MEKNDFSSELHGLVGKSREITRILEKLTSSAELVKPETVRQILSMIVEAYASEYCGHSGFKGIKRNEAVEEICRQLNALQDDLVFQDGYKISLENPSRKNKTGRTKR